MLNRLSLALLFLFLTTTFAAADPVTSAVSGWFSSISFSSVISSTLSGITSTFIGSMVSRIFGLNKKRNERQREDIGQLQTVIAGNAWLPHVYGQCRVGTIVTDQFVTNASGQVLETGEYAYAVYAISVGEIESVSQIYYYDMPMLTVTPNFDTVYSGASISEKFRTQIEIELKNGSSSQSISSLLSGITGQSPNDSTTRYQTSDIGGGIAYLVLKIKRDRENGIIGEATPTAITVEMNGRKVRDIRQENSPYVFSANPALICLEEIRDSVFGAGIPNENIDFYSFAEWADVCDDEAFTMHGRLPQGFSIGELINICETHSDTDVIDANSVITAKPNVQVVASNSITLNDSNIIQGLTREEIATSDIWTVGRVSYINSDGIPEMTIRQFDSATIDRYGYRVAELNYPMASDRDQVEKLAARALVQQTLPQISGILNIEGYEIGVGDVCTVNFSYGDILPAGSRIKITGVTKERMSSNRPVKFTGRLYDDDVFTQQLNSVIIPPSVSSTAPGVNDVPVPNVVSVTGVNNDNKVIFTLDNALAEYTLDWQIKDDTDLVWSAYSGPTNSASPVELPMPSRVFKGSVRLRYVNTTGVKGLWATETGFDNSASVPVFTNPTTGDIYVNEDNSGGINFLQIAATALGSALLNQIFGNVFTNIFNALGDSDSVGIFDRILGHDSDIEQLELVSASTKNTISTSNIHSCDTLCEERINERTPTYWRNLYPGDSNCIWSPDDEKTLEVYVYRDSFGQMFAINRVYFDIEIMADDSCSPSCFYLNSIDPINFDADSLGIDISQRGGSMMMSTPSTGNSVNYSMVAYVSTTQADGTPVYDGLITEHFVSVRDACNNTYSTVKINYHYNVDTYPPTGVPPGNVSTGTLYTTPYGVTYRWDGTRWQRWFWPSEINGTLV